MQAAIRQEEIQDQLENVGDDLELMGELLGKFGCGL